MNDLGEKISVHKPDERKLAPRRFVGKAFIVVGILVGIGTVVAAAIWLSGRCEGGVVAGLAGGTLFCGFIGWAGLGIAKASKATFTVYEEGLEILEDGSTTLVRWEEITQVAVDVRNTYCGGFLYGFEHGTKWIGFVAMFLEDGEQLGQSILENTSRRMLDDAIAALKKGEPVTFGELTVDRTGMQFPSGTAIRWKDVSMMVADFANGDLLINRQGTEWNVKWRPWGLIHKKPGGSLADTLMVWTGGSLSLGEASLKLIRIHNPHVFLKLVQVILRIRES